MLSDVVQSLLDFAGVVPDDRVLLVAGDGPPLEVRVALEAALSARCASAQWLVSPSFDPRLEDAPELLARALDAADVTLDLVADHESLIHTPSARRRVREEGMRLVVVTLRDEDWSSRFATFPVERLFERASAAAKRLRPGGLARLTAANGTDLRFGVRTGSMLGMPGGAKPRPMERGRGDFGLFPPGAVGVSPEGAEGAIVLDGLVGFRGPLATPIRIGVEAGSVRNVAGGPEADWLRERIASHPSGGHVAKLLVGIHPVGPVAGGLAELTRRKGRLSRAEGIVLVGFGDARAVGGSVASDWHWDGVILPPVTWDVGGRPLFRSGVLQGTPEVANTARLFEDAPHRPRLIARAGELAAFLVNARGAMRYAHRNPDSDELWVPLAGPPLAATVGDGTLRLGVGQAAFVPRGVPHTLTGGEAPAPMLVVERLRPAAGGTTNEAHGRVFDVGSTGATPAWMWPARPLVATDSFVVEAYARPEGMLRAESHLLDPEMWIVLRGHLAVQWDGRYPAAGAAAGDVLVLPAGGTARVISMGPDSLALRVVAG